MKINKDDTYMEEFMESMGIEEIPYYLDTLPRPKTKRYADLDLAKRECLRNLLKAIMSE